MDNKVKVLVTGVGAIIGYGIVKSLKKSSIPIHIIGIDIFEDAYGASLCDSFFQGVKAESEEYLDFINNLVAEQNIDLIIPGIEQDLYKLWQNKDNIACKIVLNNDLSINLSKDKLDTFLYLKEYDIKLIPTLSNTNFSNCTLELGLPFLIKPRSSYASKGIEKIFTEEDFIYYTNKLNRHCIYQRIIGDNNNEYTVSIFGNGNGNYFDSIILQRTLSGEGATNKAKNIMEDNSIMDYVSKICQILKPIGPTNIQLRKEENVIYLLEINPRISSACSIRTEMGYNEPEMCIQYFLQGKKLQPTKKSNLKVVRFIDDFFLTNENSGNI